MEKIGQGVIEGYVVVTRDSMSSLMIPVMFLSGSQMFASSESTSSGSVVLEDIVKLPFVSLNPIENAREVAETALEFLRSEFGRYSVETDKPIALMNLAKVREQMRLWKELLPRVRPFYAVKCNPDPVLVSELAKLGAGFDTASSEEMLLVNEVVPEVMESSQAPNNIVFANPMKKISHIIDAKNRGVDLLVFDSLSELRKIRQVYPSARLLLRLKCDDTSAQCPLSCKFGASMDAIASLLTSAREMGLHVEGVSFHVGSGCSEPGAFDRALSDAREVFDMAEDLGFTPSLLDIGGGFPGDDNEGFRVMASRISELLEKLFPSHVSVIAEPGRFFAASSVTLVTKVVGVAESISGGIRYYLNDGLYGAFNCVLYDHQAVTPHVLNPRREEERCTIFGPTCDGFDMIVNNLSLPRLEEGDHLIWMDMGAYTTSASTGFNGIERARYWYYYQDLV